MKRLIQSVWVVRAGAKSSAHELFMKHGFIVLARQKMGDLRLLPKDRQAFYAILASIHPSWKRKAVSGIGGKFFRFIHEVSVGNVILYPCRLDKRIYFGKAVGAYFYDDSHGQEFPHRRKVRWEGSFKKSDLSEFAARELGAARTFFRFSKNLDELIKLTANCSDSSPTRQTLPAARA